MRHFFTKTGFQDLKKLSISKTLFAFDYDGTLTALTPRISEAKLSLKTKNLLKKLHTYVPIVIVSGRSVSDLKATCSFKPTLFIGNHGLEGIGIGKQKKIIFYKICKKWKEKLVQNISNISGVELEYKKYSLAIHYRYAHRRAKIKHLLLKYVSELYPSPKIILGKSVINLLPNYELNKGVALKKTIQKLKVTHAVYIGDDQTDEDVFRLPGNSILKIRVGKKKSSAAHFYLKNHFEINRFLNEILDVIPGLRLSSMRGEGSILN